MKLIFIKKKMNTLINKRVNDVIRAHWAKKVFVNRVVYDALEKAYMSVKQIKLTGPSSLSEVGGGGCGCT